MGLSDHRPHSCNPLSPSHILKAHPEMDIKDRGRETKVSLGGEVHMRLAHREPLYRRNFSSAGTFSCLESEVKCVTLASEGALEGCRAEA